MSRALLCSPLIVAIVGPGCAGAPHLVPDEVASEVSTRLGEDIAWSAQAARDLEREALADRKLAVDEAVRLAILNNYKMRAILEEIGIARAQVIRAVLLPNPVLDAELQFVESGGGEIVELTAAQSVIDLLLLPIRKQIADERFEEAKATVTAAVLDLATETRIAYRRLQAQLELVGVLTSSANATYFAYEAAQRLWEAGNIIELDVLTQQSLHEETKVALARAQSRARQLRENLNLILGLWGEASGRWEVEPRLPVAEELDADPTSLEQQVVGASLDLEAAHHEILALGHKLRLGPLEVIFSEGSLGATAEKEPDNVWSAGPLGSLSIPLFNFGQGELAEGGARLRQALERYTDMALRIRRSARAAYVEASTSAANSRYLREVVLPLRSRITEQTQRQFNAMQIGVFQLLEAKQGEIDAGRRYVEALRDHWIARARIESLLLGRLPRLRFGIEVGGRQGLSDSVGEQGEGGH